MPPRTTRLICALSITLSCMVITLFEAPRDQPFGKTSCLAFPSMKVKAPWVSRATRCDSARDRPKAILRCCSWFAEPAEQNAVPASDVEDVALQQWTIESLHQHVCQRIVAFAQ